MKKLLVLSDTHGHRANISAVLGRALDIDIIIHLGDYSRDARYIRNNTKHTVYSLRGNCDFSEGEDELELTIEGVHILALHGHKQSVKTSLLRLGLYAQEKQADLALFGHTHIPVERRFHSVRLYNPGSLGEPRILRPSFGIVSLDCGTIKITTVKL